MTIDLFTPCRFQSTTGTFLRVQSSEKLTLVHRTQRHFILLCVSTTLQWSNSASCSELPIEQSFTPCFDWQSSSAHFNAKETLGSVLWTHLEIYSSLLAFLLNSSPQFLQMQSQWETSGAHFWRWATSDDFKLSTWIYLMAHHRVCTQKNTFYQGEVQLPLGHEA